MRGKPDTRAAKAGVLALVLWACAAGAAPLALSDLPQKYEPGDKAKVQQFMTVRAGCHKNPAQYQNRPIWNPAWELRHNCWAVALEHMGVIKAGTAAAQEQGGGMSVSSGLSGARTASASAGGGSVEASRGLAVQNLSSPTPNTPVGNTKQRVNGDSGLVVRASQGALTIPRSGGYAIEPATMYAHKGLNFVTGDVGWVIATSIEDAAKVANNEYGYSNLAQALQYGRTQEYLALDFGWFAFIDSYVESAKYPGNLSSDGAKRVWAYAARSREEAINTAIREYDNVRGDTVAQFVYSGLVAKIDRRGRGNVMCTICRPDMLYRSFCSLGGKQDRFVKFLNRNPRLLPSQFEGALCETNETIPFMRSQENRASPVLK